CTVIRRNRTHLRRRITRTLSAGSAGAEDGHLHHPGTGAQRRRRIVTSRATDDLVFRYAAESVDDSAGESTPRRLKYGGRIARPNDQLVGRSRRRLSTVGGRPT